MRTMLMLLAFGGVTPVLSAQVVVQSGFGFSFGGPHFRVSGFSSVIAARGPCFAPTYRPWGLYAPTPLVVVVPQPVFIVPQNYNLLGFETSPAPQPRVDRTAWHVVRPERVPAFPAVVRPMVPGAAAVAVREDRLPDAVRDAARQVQLARTAFAANEYGRAAERLDVAIRQQPNEPLPYFLLAQVRTARGEYADAVAAIRDGLRIAPDWPASTYSPRPLYAGDAVAWDRQLKELKNAAATYPDDVTVQFLLAYQIWFTGDRDEAALIFRRLAPRVKDRAAVEAFLNVAVGRTVRR